MTRFLDRADAGIQLASLLQMRGLEGGVVLGIPRGGVPVAAEVARALGAELGIVVAHKLGAPNQPELAVGAVTADGGLWVNEQLAAQVGADSKYLAEEEARQVREARRREEEFDGSRRLSVVGRTVIVVDDGLATGATAIAALRAMRERGAGRVILAIPVGPPDTIQAMRAEADDVICLASEPDFYAVGQFYVDFRPVPDHEVRAILDRFAGTRRSFDARDPVIERDGVRLAARLVTPPGGGPFPCVIFVHGLGSSKDSPRNVVIAEGLRDWGIASLLFDLNGHGESTGDPAGERAGFTADLGAVWRWTRALTPIDPSRIGISGSSLGGVVALDAYRQGRVAPAVFVLRAPPISAAELRGLTTPTVIVVGSRDPLATGIAEAAATCPAIKLCVVPGATHLFEEAGALEEASRLTIDAFNAALAAHGVALS